MGEVLAKPKSDVLQGTLAVLILKTLEHGAMHGYGITLHIQRVSSDVLRVEEGSLYPALHRMEQDGWITARSEEHTSELQSRLHLVCRLLLEKKKKKKQHLIKYY